MENTYNLLSKQWEILSLFYGETIESQMSESRIVIELGKAIVTGNLELMGCGRALTDKIMEIYASMFGTDPNAVLPDFPFKALVDPMHHDILGALYENHIENNDTRRPLGQFYSPPEVVSYMIERLEMSTDQDLLKRKFIDIACGTGVFLVNASHKAIAILRKRGVACEDILPYVVNNFYGLDINPVACLISKINMFIRCLLEFGPDLVADVGPLSFPIFETNSIENRSDISDSDEALRLKKRLSPYQQGFDYIMGNPPYLEAKKMPQDVKGLCRANFPDVMFGAFDLYIAFIAQCNNLSAEGGKIALILPNKFLVARYAERMRRQLLDEFRLIEITDLSEMDLFHKTDVYPIVLIYAKGAPEKTHSLVTKMSIRNYSQMYSKKTGILLPQRVYKRLGERATFFCLPPDDSYLDLFTRLFEEGEPLYEYLIFRSTVSFHRKGLREQFVKQEFDKADDKLIRPYLGGISYAKRNEVGKYTIDWRGYYINYDETGLKAIGNSLPPLSNFERPKIIFCQHAREITATLDKQGKWVTKDVYPIAFEGNRLKDSTHFSLRYFTGLLNSKLYSFIYGIIYKGIQISAGYYHYLPTWIDKLPVFKPDKGAITQVENLVDEALEEHNESIRDEIIAAIDELVFEIHDIDASHRKEIHAFFQE